MLPPELRELLPDGDALLSADPIGGSGSNRRYWRLHFVSGRELIACQGTDVRENEAFIYLAERLRANGVNVPEVVAVSAGNRCYLQTSVGSRALFDCLERTDLIASSMELLARAQSAVGIDYARCYPVPEMDRRAIMWDLNYFKYCFLKTTPGMEIDEPALENDFERLADIILSAGPRGFMVRDFQSRNVMIDSQGRPALIDFQGGRLGPVHYDVASFLWQARAGFAPELRSRMVSHYCAAAGLAESDFRAVLPYFVVFRLLQTLGTYGFRGRFERKERFLSPIPAAVASLRDSLAELPGAQLPSIAAHLR